tara:strand:- start:15891 stop:17192 length:1302 start_codon:yes stop_codon:yes gene_type:complete
MISDKERKDFESKAGGYLTIARQRCAMDQPFFSTFTVGKQWSVDWSVETAYTDGKHMGYNPAFICYIFDKFGGKGVVAIIVHEAAHIFFGHHLRRQRRDPQEWNIAIDHVVNNMLMTCKPVLCLDGDWLCDRKYKNWESERVFYDLFGDTRTKKTKPQSGFGTPDNECNGGKGGDEKSPNQGQSDDGEPTTKDEDGKYMIGEVRDMKGDNGEKLTEEQKDEALQELQGMAINAANAAKKAGKIPGALRKYVEDLLEPRQDWRSILSMFVGERSRNDYRMSKPSPTAACNGYFSPVIESEDIAKFIVAVDTSGSMNFVEAVSEVQGCLETYEDEGVDTTVRVLYCDTKVHHMENLSIGNKPFKGGHGGGGGTSFSPAVNWVRDNREDEAAFIYITDGYCDDFGQDPGLPVLWLLTTQRNNTFTPPFGDVIQTDI